MYQGISFLKNSFAVLMLFGILMAAFVTTLTLSPVAVESQQVAGAFDTTTGEVISNFIPLTIEDSHTNTTQYSTQLVRVDDRTFNYFVNLAASPKQILDKEFLRVRNDNNAPVNINITANLPTTVNTSMNVTVAAPNRKFAVYNGKSSTAKTAVITIPAKSSVDLKVEYEYLQNVAFGVELAMQVTY